MFKLMKYLKSQDCLRDQVDGASVQKHKVKRAYGNRRSSYPCIVNFYISDITETVRCMGSLKIAHRILIRLVCSHRYKTVTFAHDSPIFACITMNFETSIRYAE